MGTAVRTVVSRLVFRPAGRTRASDEPVCQERAFEGIVKLIDVYPGDASPSESCDVPMGGFQMHVAGEIMRGKFRNSLENPEPMVPGEVARIDIDLKDKFHTFLAGHRIMVHVQSSWFPAYDRNPQTFVDIYHAEPEDYQVATQTIHRSVESPSHLVLGVMR